MPRLTAPSLRVCHKKRRCSTLSHFHPIFPVGALRPYTNRSRREQSCGAKDVTINAAVLDAHISARTESRVGWCIACLASAGILLLPAIWNGFPLLEYDTGGYLARWLQAAATMGLWHCCCGGNSVLVLALRCWAQLSPR